MVRPPFWWSLFALLIVTHNAPVSSNKGSVDDINTRCEVRSPVDIILYWKQTTPTQNENVTLCPSDQSEQSDDSCIKGKLSPSNEVKSGNVYMFTIFNQSSVFKAIIVYDVNTTAYNETVEVDIDQCWQTGLLKDSSVRCELRGPVRLTLSWKQNVKTLQEHVYLCLDNQILDDCIKGKQFSYDGTKHESINHFENVQPNATYKAVLTSVLEDKTVYNKTIDIDINKCLKQGCKTGTHFDHNFFCNGSGVRHCKKEMIVNGACLVHHHTKVRGESSVLITLHVHENVDSDYQLNTSHHASINKTKNGCDVNFTGLMPGEEVKVQMMLNTLIDNDTNALKYIRKAYSMPAAPSDLQGRCSRPDNVRLTWSQRGFCATTLCRVCPALGPEDTCVSVNGTRCGGAGVKELTCDLNVQPDVNYTATVEINNGAGDKVTRETTVNCSSTSKYSGGAQINYTPAAPMNLKGHCDSQGNITLIWNQTGLCTKTVCRLCPVGGSDRCVSVSGPSCGDSGTKELSCTVSLPHGVAYNAFVEIHGDGGVKTNSSTTVNCCSTQVPAALTNLQVHCNSQGDITLTWNQTGLCTRTLCRLCPELKTEEDCTVLDIPRCGNTDAEEKSCNMKVRTNTNYTADVALHLTTGCQTKMQTTVNCYSASVPAQPTGLQSTWKAPGEIKLEWNQHGPISQSVCKLCPIGKPGNSCLSVRGPNSPNNGTANDLSCDFTLQQDVKYKFVVEVSNSDGEKANGTVNIDYYFNSEPVRSASVTGVGTRSVNVSMKASCLAMICDVGYVVVNISNSPRCLVFGTSHTKCSQENRQLLSAFERQPDIPTDVCEGDADRDFILPVSGLTPSTTYTLLLVPWYCGYNHGNTNNSFILETTTDPLEPWNVTIENVTWSNNTVTIIWPLPDLDPGLVIYSLYITDAIKAPPGEKNMPTICSAPNKPWSGKMPCPVSENRKTMKRQCSTLVPYAFWNYKVALVVTTAKGSLTSQATNVESTPQAPGPVAALHVSTKNMSDLTNVCGHVTWTEYSDVCVMWKETCPHQRGNFIHGYLYRLAPDDSGSISQVSPSLLLTHGNDTLRMRSDWNETSYFKLLRVATDTNYTFCVRAVGPSPNITGTEKCTQFYLPAIEPSLSRGDQYKVEKKDIPRQTHSHRVTFTMKSTCFMVKSTYGNITDNGLIISKGPLKQDVDFSELPSWFEREKFGYYKTKPDYLNSQSDCNTSRSVVVGKDACSPGDNRTGKYCDGPLDPGTKYSINAMVCTKAGCSSTTVVDNISTPGPGNVTIENVTFSNNTVTITWPLPDFDPDPVNYTLLIADAIQAPPGEKNTTTACSAPHKPWSHTVSCPVPATRNTTTGHCSTSVPYAFWNYKVAVVVTTAKGNLTSQATNVESTPQAPGPVAALHVSTKNMSDLTNVCGHVTWTEYTDVCVMWKETCPHQRGNFIHGYLYRLTPVEGGSTHQVSSSLLLTHGNDAVRMRKDWNETSYFKLLRVATDTNYTFCVRAVGPSPNITGTENCTKFYLPAIKPSLPRGDQYKVEKKDIPRQTHSHRVTFTMKSTCFMVKSTFGNITDNGLIISKGPLKHDVDLAKLPSWFERDKFGYYKTKPDYLNSQSNCNTSRSVVVGKDACLPGDNRPGKYCDGPLDPGTKYSINAMVCTKAGCSSTTVVDNIATPEVTKPSHSISLHSLVVICVAPVLLIAIAFLVYVIIRAKRRQGSKTSATEMTLWQSDPSAWKRSQAKQHSWESGIQNQTRPIPLSKLEEVIKRKEQGDNERLREEFKAINSLSRTFPVDNSTMDCNRGKNRFADIFAYDHSRVRLSIQDEEEGSDYINANFIPGYNRDDEYIASQGPLPRTKDDMWRMVWEYRVPMIIMLTQTQEKGRVMCEEYWPSAPGEVRLYGQLIVTAAASSAFEDYVITRLLVKHSQEDAEVLQVFHLQYLVWPDMTADVSVDSILTLLRVVRHLLHDSPRPLVVHCSAGVGRTGTFICLDYIMQFIRNRPMSDKLDIFKFILQMREYRCRMVQTVNQYIFIHNVARHLIAARKHTRKASKSHEAGGIASSLSEAEMMLLPRPSDESMSTSEGTELIEADMKEEDVPEVDKFLRVSK